VFFWQKNQLLCFFVVFFNQAIFIQDYIKKLLYCGPCYASFIEVSVTNAIIKDNKKDKFHLSQNNFQYQYKSVLVVLWVQEKLDNLGNLVN
jgi:hypothetical protein